jgi:3' terminal RNA ribose 2'-O-methyltransferase Hen1
MLLTLTCYAPNASDVGYLLGKNPASTFERPFSAGTVWVFYPEVADDHVTVALLMEIDPVGLVRGPAALAQLDQYVNDRPYVASSLTSVALKTAFSTALAGRSASPSRSGRLDERMRWVVTLPAVACDGGDDLIQRIFAPLGYAVTADQLSLDERFPAWGMASMYQITLDGRQTTQDVLTHLYVLLPVLDNSKHYYVGAEETDKLLAHGGAWLAAHPERDLIARRYLRYKRPLVQSALDRLIAADAQEAADAEHDAEHDADTEDGEGAAPPAEDQTEPELGLHELRLNTALAAIREAGARSLADLGCGEGKLLTLALKERTLTRIMGMDVSSIAISRARRRLHLDTLPTAQRLRIELIQGSLLYRDQRLAGFDVVSLVEVVEHLDSPRLAAMERVVFQHARPRRVIVTTPNREYNAHWQAVGETRLRHSDHRFEWTRAECCAWAERVAAQYGYRMAQRELGPVDSALGAPSQLIIFDRKPDTDDQLREHNVENDLGGSGGDA